MFIYSDKTAVNINFKMLELFRTHFHDMAESLDLTINIVTDKIEEKKHRARRIGYFTQAEEQNNSESDALEVAASLYN